MTTPSDTAWTRWLPGVATVLSMAACYGTLGLISLLGAMGFALVVDDTIWAGAIVAFAVLAVVGIALGMMRHRQPWPLLVSAIGAGVVAYAMYVHYDRLIEFAGFAILCGAAFWDWRLRQAHSCERATISRQTSG